jgi:release factor glutamine methyltransferase
MQDETPEAYRLGSIPFLGVDISLASRPLIPRVETEWWTEQLARRIVEGAAGRRPEARRPASGPGRARQNAPRGLRILDLCAGSGAIGCALLAALPGAELSFGEIDPAHEPTIRENLRRNGLGAAEVRIGDLFAPFAGERFDIVVANPPYVPEGRALPSSVADYEPALALRAGADGLALIRRIARGLAAYLLPGGEAWVECDSAHAEAAAELFRAEGFSARILPDQYARPRVIIASEG